jgi:hypothetical protein
MPLLTESIVKHSGYHIPCLKKYSVTLRGGIQLWLHRLSLGLHAESVRVKNTCNSFLYRKADMEGGAEEAFYVVFILVLPQGV